MLVFKNRVPFGGSLLEGIGDLKRGPKPETLNPKPGPLTLSQKGTLNRKPKP